MMTIKSKRPKHKQLANLNPFCLEESKLFAKFVVPLLLLFFFFFLPPTTRSFPLGYHYLLEGNIKPSSPF